MPKWEVSGRRPSTAEERRLYSKQNWNFMEAQSRAEKVKRGKTLGPKSLFQSYRENMPLEQAIEKILQEFPIYNRDIIMSWISSEENEKIDNRPAEERDDDDER